MIDCGSQEHNGVRVQTLIVFNSNFFYIQVWIAPSDYLYLYSLYGSSATNKMR